MVKLRNVTRGGYEESEDGGTLHEYHVEIEILSHPSIWVHQVDGRIVRAGIEPPVCTAIP